jgi:integrase/recombinase XerD
MSALSKALEDYLHLRRGLGYTLEREETRLRQFIGFLESKRISRITIQAALQFATQHPELAPQTKSGRLSAVRGFARYQIGIDPATEIPPVGLLPRGSRPAKPYLYSKSEIRQILKAAEAFGSPHRFQRRTYYCLFGLLAVTGMRRAEVLNLRPQDVDLSEGILTIQKAKFGKSRLIPLHASTVGILSRYAKDRDQFFAKRPHLPVSHFFVTSRGTRLLASKVGRVFLTISRRIGLRAPRASHGPRLHDLRHRFAHEALLRWYRRGEQVDRRLPVLSTYLGHTHVSSTYWYWRGTPKLMAAACQRLEQRWKGVR